ncbi:hypothetical protein ACIBEJ_29790 [Nonomuraea sp. NPDC050790]|uniref:hypothetical protein n=1 Tax=Nonomuraea sp. NPDC050790 TaxID=3364371 RepID=UPI0037BC87F1
MGGWSTTPTGKATSADAVASLVGKMLGDPKHFYRSDSTAELDRTWPLGHWNWTSGDCPLVDGLISPFTRSAGIAGSE